jgi:dienelactone hydrolase
VPALLVLASESHDDPVMELELIRGDLTSVDPPADPRRARVRTNKEGASFHAPATEQAWRDRSRAVREQLLVTMGLWPMPPKTPLHPRVVGKLERDGYTIEKVVLETLPGFTLSGNLYRPVGTSGKLPAVLCPHGHWKDGRVNPEVQQRCIRLAKLGCVVFMYDMVGYNDSEKFGHKFLNDRLRRWGYSLVSLQTWDSIRALDWVMTLPDVDPERIACTGESGGGTQTFLLTAVDDRVKVAAPVVMVSDSFQGGCVCENCAGLRIGTDNVEIAALTAPRPMKLVGATGDWTAKTMTNAYPAIRGVYRLLGSPERLSADLFNFEHNYNQTTRNAVYPFLARWLLGVEDSESTREGEQTPEKPEDLWTYTEKTPAPANLKTPAELENDLVKTLSWELDALAPSTSTAAWEAARGFLKTSHRVRVGLVNPPAAEVTETELRRTSHGGITVIHARVGRKSVGENIPVVRLIPKDASGKLTVVTSPHGKAALVIEEGPISPLVRALIKRGQSVVMFDPLFVGESIDPSAPALKRPGTLHSDTYNPTLAADQMQDLATVLAWARSRPDVREVSLAGMGRSGPQVLLARPALEGLARTAVDLHAFDPGDGSVEIAPELDLPGLLQFGGLKAAALIAPAPVWIFRPGERFDRAWPEKAYALVDAPAQLKIDDARPSADALARWLDTGE